MRDEIRSYMKKNQIGHQEIKSSHWSFKIYGLLKNKIKYMDDSKIRVDTPKMFVSLETDINKILCINTEIKWKQKNRVKKQAGWTQKIRCLFT